MHTHHGNGTRHAADDLACRMYGYVRVRTNVCDLKYASNVKYNKQFLSARIHAHAHVYTRVHFELGWYLIIQKLLGD